MKLAEFPLNDFNKHLASGEPIPGGGGAAAAAAALGAALAGMVASLTVGKKKYAEHETELQAILAEAEAMRLRAEAIIDADAEAYARVSAALRLKKDAPFRAEVLEDSLRDAAKPPMEIMELCAAGIALHGRLFDIGSRHALSDVGSGAALLQGASQAAAMSVFANTTLMKDKDYAADLNIKCLELMRRNLNDYDDVYWKVRETLI